MSPTIDVHTHLFSALDIPLEGYLLSRRSERRIGRMIDPWISIFPMPQIFGYVARRARERCVTRRLDEDLKRGWFYTAVLWLYGKIAGQRFLDWEDALTSCPAVKATRLIETWPEVDLFGGGEPAASERLLPGRKLGLCAGNPAPERQSQSKKGRANLFLHRSAPSDLRIVAHYEP